MRFLPQKRSSVIARATGLLALSGAILSVSAQDDACKKLHNFLKETKNDGTMPFPAKMAYDCQKAVPIDLKYAAQTAEQLMGYHEMVSYQVYHKKPPLAQLELKAHDGEAEIKKIQEKVKKGEYKYLYDFSLDCFRVFNRYQDGHTTFVPALLYPVLYGHNTPIISFADSITGEPKVWTLTGERGDTLHKEIDKINEVPVKDYLLKFLAETDEWFGFADPDTRWNMLMSQFPITNEDEGLGYFQYRGIYPGEESFTIKFKDGTVAKVEWKAMFQDKDIAGLLTSAANVGKHMWLGDEEYKEVTRPLTAEEVKIFEREWGLENQSKKSPGGKEANVGSPHVKTGSSKHHTATAHPNHVDGWKRKLRKRNQFSSVPEVSRFTKRAAAGVPITLSKRSPAISSSAITKRWSIEQLTRKISANANGNTHDEDDDEDDEDDELDEEDDDDDEDEDEDEDDELDSKNTTGYPPSFKASADNFLAWYDLDGQTAVLDITSFGRTSAAEEYEDVLDYGLAYVKKTGHKRLIIDLTNNPGGAAYLPFDFVRTFFPKNPIFETVNQRYTKSNILGFAFENPEHYWDINGKDFKKVEDIFGPVKKDGDDFTAFYKYDDIQAGKESLGLKWDPNAPQPFDKDNIIIVSNGVCGSSCAAFLEAFEVQGVRTYAFGGRPNGKKEMQGSGGIKGGVIGFFEDYNLKKQYLLSKEDTKSLATVLPDPVRLRAAGTINFENQFRNGKENGYPLQFVYAPACKRLQFTKEMLTSVKHAWEAAKNLGWDKDGKKIACDIEYKTSNSGLGRHDTLRGDDGTPRGPVPPEKKPWRA